MNEELYQEQGISFSDILFLVKRNILLILVITILCTIVGGVYAYGIKKPVYTAEATAVVQAEPSTNGNEATSYSYSVALTNTFKTIIKSIAVVNEAADDLIESKVYSEEERQILKSRLQKNVSVSSETSTLIVTISAQSKDPEEAILLANSILDATISVVDEFKIDVETGEPVKDQDGNVQYNYIILANKLKVLNEASDDTTFVKSGKLMIIAVAVLIGIIISFAIILIKFLSDDTYTSKDSFEKTFNINILSSIQNAEGGN